MRETVRSRRQIWHPEFGFAELDADEQTEFEQRSSQVGFLQVCCNQATLQFGIKAENQTQPDDGQNRCLRELFGLCIESQVNATRDQSPARMGTISSGTRSASSLDQQKHSAGLIPATDYRNAVTRASDSDRQQAQREYSDDPSGTSEFALTTLRGGDFLR